MRCSADFVFRRTSGVHKEPRHRVDVDDHIFGPMMNVQANHQKFLDISRLSAVSGSLFSKIALCCNVQYLDLSYNRIDGEHITLLSDSCRSLRSLVMAGLKFTTSSKDYEPLEKLSQSIELLSLRNCDNLTSLAFCHGMLLLRSLDVGETSVSSIAPLAKLTRLEELCLDLCDKLSSGEENITALSQLGSLRLLNVCGTVLENYQREDGMILVDVLHQDICVESKPRRELFVEALMENNEPVLHRLIGSGQDVNIRVGPWAENLFTETWRTRCKTPKLQTPYFLLDHPDTEMLPTPLHIAIMFNSQDAVALLRLVNADPKKECWFSDVVERNFRLDVDEVKSSQQKQQVFTTDELVDAMFERNVYRLTDGMVAKKMTDWKKRCLEAREDIKLIMRHEFPQVLEKRRIEAERLAEIERVNLEKRRQHEAMVQAEMDAKAAEERKARELQAKKDAHFMGQFENPEVKDAAPHATATIAWTEETQQKPDNPNEDTNSKASNDGFYGGEDDAPGTEAELDQSRPGTAAQMAEDKSSLCGVGGAESKAEPEPEPEPELEPEPEAPDSLEPETYKKPGRKPLAMLPKRPEHFSWRKHGMVAKLLDPPVQYKSTRNRLDVPVLGKKSYWLESANYELHSRLHREEKIESEKAHLRKSNAQAAADYKRMLMQKGLREVPKKAPVPERKIDFLTLVDARTQRKYIVRDDISDDGKEANESDSDKSM